MRKTRRTLAAFWFQTGERRESLESVFCLIFEFLKAWSARNGWLEQLLVGLFSAIEGGPFASFGDYEAHFDSAKYSWTSLVNPFLTSQHAN